MFEVYGIHPKYAETAENDRGELVEYNFSRKLISTDSKETVERVIELAKADGWEDIIIHEFDPAVYELPDFTKAVRL